MAEAYAIESFKRKMQTALDRVKVILAANRAPCFASDIHHQYQDKYLLAECLTNTALGSQVNCLTKLGLSAEQIAQLCEWTQTKTVSLTFRAEERCEFVREETREVESPTKHVTEVSVGGAPTAELTSKVVTTVTDYFWKYTVTYELKAIRGVGGSPEDQMPMLSRTGEIELKTSTKSPPHPEVRVPAAEFDVNVSWLFKRLNKDSLAPSVEIDRAHAKCHTPRRNPDMESALEHFMPFYSWADSVANYLSKNLQVKPVPNALYDPPVFVPVLPLFEDKEGADAAAADASAAAAAAAEPAGVLAVVPSSAALAESVLIAMEDVNALLKEEMRSLLEKHTNVQAMFPSDGPGGAAEAALIVTLKHCSAVCTRWGEALDYIEFMLRSQLIAAIGKEVTPADFAEYMTFHNRKLFAERYAPAPFCFAVRRSERHSPEGTLSIEQETVGGGGDSNIAAPIVTLAAHTAREHRMQFPISASTNVCFGGDKYLHAWLQHQFSGQTGAQLKLVSRARQFSSFLVLVGRVASATVFEPKYAAIIQNKDELKIPLDLSTIPTPKEFKDAIESLSPEQQAFAKAFRSMQLASTLFGILVIQIKPQLEKVLNLPEDSLTKEIKLTQELMTLFIKYQIPSDLLSFDGTDGEIDAEVVGGSGSEKLAAVKKHVEDMNAMIEQSKNEEIHLREMEHAYEEPRAMMRSAPRMMMAESGAAPPAPHMMARSRGAPAPPAAAGGAAPVFASCPVPSPPPAAAAPAPAPTTEASQQQNRTDTGMPDDDSVSGVRDFTKVPREMDQRFERLDLDNSLRPTIINPSGNWTKRAQKALLASPTTSSLGSKEQKTEKDAAFDLLDALTKSGALPVENASLHIVVAATHCFDRTVTDTVVMDNVNPIDKVERSTLIMATTVHQQPAAALIREAQVPRVSATSPQLFLEDA